MANKKEIKQTELIAVRVETQYINELKNLAAKDERTLSFLVRKAIINFLKETEAAN